MKKTELAWAAGFFDGEGCISLLGRTPTLIVTQKDIEPLLRFKKIFGIGNIKLQSMQTPAGKDTYVHHYKVYGANATYVLSLILPYLTVKREKALDALNHRQNMKHTLSPQNWQGDKMRLNKILLLRQRGLSFADIGKALGISRQRTHQLYIIAQALIPIILNPILPLPPP